MAKIDDQSEMAALLEQLRALVQSAKPGDDGPDETVRAAAWWPSDEVNTGTE
jgi:hypothetical protein